MRKVIIDSGIWIGAFVSKDRWHENGKRFYNGYKKKKRLKL